MSPKLEPQKSRLGMTNSDAYRGQTDDAVRRKTLTNWRILALSKEGHRNSPMWLLTNEDLDPLLTDFILQ